MDINNADPHYPIPPEKLVSLALQHLESQFIREGPLSSPNLVADFLRLKLSLMEREIFAAIFMCNRHQVIAYEELFFGTINGATVHPREIAKRALELNAAALILAHNHPSGVPEPSQSDQAITNKIVDALSLFEIRVLDHIIVGGAEFVSFSERGLL